MTQAQRIALCRCRFQGSACVQAGGSVVASPCFAGGLSVTCELKADAGPLQGRVGSQLQDRGAPPTLSCHTGLKPALECLYWPL